MKFVVDSGIPFLEGVLETYGNVVYREGACITCDDIRDADALVVRTRTRCDAELLEGSRVKFIATATIGFDHIDMEYCRGHGIEVFVAAGCNAGGVLQYMAAVFAFLEGDFHASSSVDRSCTLSTLPHSLCRSAQKSLLQNPQKPNSLSSLPPSHFTLGIVGVGHVGSLVAEYAQMWGFRVLTNDINPPAQASTPGGITFLPLDEVARQADILTFHVPLDALTRYMADARLLSLTKPECVVVNTSRGGVVDERALLASGRRYVLDVWEHEPNLDRDVLTNALLATPHIAGYSLQGKANATSMVVVALLRKFGLTPPPRSGTFDTRPSTRPISWDEMRDTIRGYFDIEAESHALKSHPDRFEELRNNYKYREEYF